MGSVASGDSQVECVGGGGASGKLSKFILGEKGAKEGSPDRGGSGGWLLWPIPAWPNYSWFFPSHLCPPPESMCTPPAVDSYPPACSGGCCHPCGTEATTDCVYVHEAFIWNKELSGLNLNIAHCHVLCCMSCVVSRLRVAYTTLTFTVRQSTVASRLVSVRSGNAHTFRTRWLRWNHGLLSNKNVWGWKFKE